jgi:hypothetical protein
MEIWVITNADKQDLTWLMGSNILHIGGSTYCGDPCISVYPSEKQLTILSLKFSERLIKVAITSREMLEILNPKNLFLLV